MKNLEISELLEGFDVLSLEEKEYAFDLLGKIIAQSKRMALESRYNEALRNYESGNVKTGGIKELYADLEDD